MSSRSVAPPKVNCVKATPSIVTVPLFAQLVLDDSMFDASPITASVPVSVLLRISSLSTVTVLEPVARSITSKFCGAPAALTSMLLPPESTSSVSVPVPPSIVASSAPNTIVSFPLPPSSVSLPLPPSRVLPFPSPVKMSSLSLPTNRSIFEKLAFVRLTLALPPNEKLSSA